MNALARLLAVLLILTHSIAESQEPAAAASKPDVNRMTIHAVAEQTGEPLAGVQVQFSGQIGGQRADQYLRTGPDGKVDFEWSKGGRIEFLWMTAKKAEFVPIHYTWRPDRTEVELAPKLELKFQPGQTIGGTVRDEAGEPIAGARVEFTMPVTWPQLQSHVFTMATLQTDEAGRWQFDGAPADAASVSITVEHPDYLAARAQATASMDNMAVMKQGPSVAGNVMDQNLEPVVGAKVLLGFSRFGSDEPSTQTDAEGRFVLKNCKTGPSLVTVVADGFAPASRELVVGEQNKELLFTLEPGHTLRARVVDVHGNPVAGAFFAADTWRGHRSLAYRVDTPADGRITWNGAPPDTVLYDIGKRGYMSTRNVAIKAGGDEFVVTLYPVLEISGMVTDAQTGEPIKDFTVTHGYQFQGNPRTYWDRDPGIDGKDGRYTYKFDEPMQGYVIKVVAEGYLPENSRRLESTEGKVTFDFQLQPGEGQQ